MTVMRERLEKLKKNKDGFTLVELIVVLVILAILIGMLVPSLTGYINKAHEKTALLECRQVVLAAQVEASSEYGKGNTAVSFDLAEIKEMAEVPGTVDTVTAVDGKVTYVRYISKRGIVVIYENGEYRIEGESSGESGGDSGEAGGEDVNDGDAVGGDESIEDNDKTLGNLDFTIGGNDYTAVGDADEMFKKAKAENQWADGIQLSRGIYKLGDAFYYVRWSSRYSGNKILNDAIKINVNSEIQEYSNLKNASAVPGNVYSYNGKYYVACEGASGADSSRPDANGDHWLELTSFQKG